MPVGDAPPPVNEALPASLTLICKLECPPAFNLIALVHVVLPEEIVQGLGEAVIKVETGENEGEGMAVAAGLTPLAVADPIKDPSEYKSKVNPLAPIQGADQLPTGFAPVPVNGAFPASLILICKLG